MMRAKGVNSSRWTDSRILTSSQRAGKKGSTAELQAGDSDIVQVDKSRRSWCESLRRSWR
jgi:hypothetical protein